MFVVCPVRQALTPTAKLAVTQGEVHSARYETNKGLIQETNITIKQNKDAPKCPFGVLVCRHATICVLRLRLDIGTSRCYESAFASDMFSGVFTCVRANLHFCTSDVHRR